MSLDKVIVFEIKVKDVEEKVIHGIKVRSYSFELKRKDSYSLKRQARQRKSKELRDAERTALKAIREAIKLYRSRKVSNIRVVRYIVGFYLEQVRNLDLDAERFLIRRLARETKGYIYRFIPKNKK